MAGLTPASCLQRLELVGRHRRWTSVASRSEHGLETASSQPPHTPRVLRRQFQLLILDLLGFTSYHVRVNGAQSNAFAQRLDVEQAFNMLEGLADSDQVELEAMVDFTREPPYSLPDADTYGREWMNLLPTPRSEPLGTFSLPTTSGACLQHMYPLMWIRIVGSPALLDDPVATKLTSTRFTRVDGQMEIWGMLEYKPPWYISRRPREDIDPEMVQGWLTAYLNQAQLPYTLAEVLWPWQLSFNSSSEAALRKTVTVDASSGIDGYSLSPKMMRMVKFWLQPAS